MKEFPAISGLMKKPAIALSAKKTLLQLIAVGALAACSSGSGNPVQDATAAIEGQDYLAARIHLMTALRENSQDPEANFLFAKTLLELGDGLGAEAALRKIEKGAAYQDRVRPLLGRAMLLKGQNEEAYALAENPAGEFASELFAVKVMALFGMERAEEAEAVLAQALTALPDDPELLWIKGNRQLSLGDLDGASQSADKALAKTPDSLEAMLLAGRLALAKSDGEKALSYFAKIRETRPDNIVAEYLRGAVHKDLGNRAKARKCFETVLRASPNHPWATFYLAQMDYEDGKSDQAFDRMQTTKADLNEVPQAVRLSGLLEMRRGNFEQAIDKLNRYMSQNRPDAEALVALSRSLSSAGNDAEAYQAIQPLAQSVTAPVDALKAAAALSRKAGSGTAENYVRRAASLEKDTVLNQVFQAEQAIIAKEWTKAEAIYDKLLVKNHPQKVMLLNNAAMVQFNLAKADQALKFAQQAHGLAPDDPMVKDTLGWILLQSRKDKVGALRLLNEASAAAPNNLEIQWHFANALAANGQADEARRIAISLQPAARGLQKLQIENLLAWI